jgi:hypothetical protein
MAGRGRVTVPARPSESLCLGQAMVDRTDTTCRKTHSESSMDVKWN